MMTTSENKHIAVLFDLDGVLVDSEGIYTEFWADIDRRYPTGIEDFAHVIKGNTLARILGTYFPDETVRDAILIELKRQEEDMVYRLFPGISDLIETLNHESIPTAIVTSSNAAKMRHLFNAVPLLRDNINIVITEEDVTNSKPDPEGYLKAAERLGVEPSRTVVFEDSLAGLEAGRRAGAVVVGVATTNPRKALENLADVIVDLASEMTVDRIRELFE
ncbi:MAG: HAD-IA family hydrolase [Muribaculaceae bacterium]|nr:HAD-IA family hydrolase [Muribaculaceae bacterium]